MFCFNFLRITEMAAFSLMSHVRASTSWRSASDSGLLIPGQHEGKPEPSGKEADPRDPWPSLGC